MIYKVTQSNRLEDYLISDESGNVGVARGVMLVDPLSGTAYNAAQGYVWSTTALNWVKAQQAGGGGASGLVQIQDSLGNNLNSTSGALDVYVVNGVVVSGTVTTVPTGTTTVAGNVTSVTPDETFRFDGSATPVLYIGVAPPGTAESAAGWKIMQVNTGSPLNILYAGGAATYVNQWSNRTGLSYS
jgi:hypothetical protein